MNARAPFPASRRAGPPALALMASLALALAASAQEATQTGSISVGGGGAFVDGDAPAFQQRLRQNEPGSVGIEDFRSTRATDNDQFRFDARIMPGEHDYRIGLRWEKFDAYYIEASWRRFRIFYDGSGGRLLPRDLAVSWFPEDLAIDRSFFHVEIGTVGRGRPKISLRYDHNERDGAKNSIRWGDSNLAGAPYSPRAFIPSELFVDETRDILTFTAAQRTEEANWKVSLRGERTRTADKHVARRRAGEAATDRYATLFDQRSTDLFSGSGFYERTLSKTLRVSAGGLFTTVDSNLGGNRIYGDSPDAAYSATFARRQGGDSGFYGLLGEAQLKQYVTNATAVWLPSKNWQLRPAVKFEHVGTDSWESHVDTNRSGTTAVANVVDAVTTNAWDEVTGDLELRYLRWTRLAVSFRAIVSEGTGNLFEQSVLTATRVAQIDRNSDYERTGQRYTFDANWYARPGLTFGLQLNYRLKLADYRHLVDNTVNSTTSTNRYPAYLIDQDVEALDGIARVSWRPTANLTLVTRYAQQRAITTSSFVGLPEIVNGHLTRRTLTQTATWNVSPRLFLSGAVNVAHDRLSVPAHTYTMASDNDRLWIAAGAGYALGKITDVYLDYSYLGADNFVDNALVTLPLNADFAAHTAYLTWVRRQTPSLIYTLRYGFASNRDTTYGGQNDFDAHLLYGKVQYKF